MVEGNKLQHLRVVSYLGKILIRGLSGVKYQNWVYANFLRNRSLKVSNFLHDGRGQ